MASIGSVQSGGMVFDQLQLQLAQRHADQAQAKARSLATQARAAETEAAQAQNNASSLRGESDQADQQAAEAQRGVTQLKAFGQISSHFSTLQNQIAQVIQSETSDVSAESVVNSYGEETGALISVTA